MRQLTCNSVPVNQAAFAGVLLLVLLSRIPFLLPGYGGEEDAWGLVLTARHIALTGLYDYSRLPGHPVQEIIYALIWNQGPFLFNLVTGLFSVAAVAFFMRSCALLGIKNYAIAGVTLAFIPVFYINSVCSMDYVWALALLMASLYFLLGGKMLLSGILLGLATGCRITSLVMLVPFLFLIWKVSGTEKRLTLSLKLFLASLFTSLLCYVPVYLKAGPGFFNYVAQIPASFFKAVYRFTIGTWGLIGFIDLFTIVLLFTFFARSKSGNPNFIFSGNSQSLEHPATRSTIQGFLLLGIGVSIIVFISLPQKAAFLVPMLPFAVIWIAKNFQKKILVVFSFSMIFSSFFLGLNLNDPLRGAQASPLSVEFNVAGQSLTLDLLRGPMMAEQQRRQNKIQYSESVLQKLDSIQSPSVIIAGFWFNDIAAKTDSLPSHIRMVYYVSEASLENFSSSGYKIFYLPEQDYYNDLCYKGKFTHRYAKPF